MSDEDVFDPLFYTAVFLLELPLGACAVFAAHSQEKLNGTLIMLFDITVIAACTTSAACAIGSVVDYDMLLTLAVWVSTLLLLLCIWCALLFRLIITFADTAYAIGRMERILYFVCFCIMATISFAFFVWIIAEYDGDMNMTWLTLTLIIFFAVYVLSVVFAVYRFTSTLMKVATAQRSSVTMSSNMDHLQGPQEAIYLDRVQRRMTRMAVKYIGTFTIALLGSIWMVAFTISSPLGMYFTVLDQIINMYVSVHSDIHFVTFGFNDKSYRKLCCATDYCCGYIIINICMGQSRQKDEEPSDDGTARPGTAGGTTAGAEFSPSARKKSTIVFAE